MPLKLSCCQALNLVLADSKYMAVLLGNLVVFPPGVCYQQGEKSTVLPSQLFLGDFTKV